MQSTRTLAALDITSISDFLTSCEQPFLTSHLYDAVEDKKLIDTERRLSDFRSIVDDRAHRWHWNRQIHGALTWNVHTPCARRMAGLFDLAENIVQQLSALDTAADFTLVRNDLTHIRYHTGGFFKKHEDYLSVTSNLIEEYTLLLCVTPPGMATVGGETVIFGHGGSQVYKETTTRGDALVFRKDMLHEGQLVEAGEKHVLSMNLWAMRKRSGQVLVVTFPAEEADVANLLGVEALHAAAHEDHSYVLAVDDAMGSEMLATHIAWTNRQAECRTLPAPLVIQHCCELFTFEQFGTMFRVLTQSHISATELAANKAVIDYYCPCFVYEHLLVDSVEKSLGAASASADLVGGVKAACDFAAPCDDVLVCESEERMRVVAELARTLKLPYVPFKMVFVEGVLQIFGECGDDAFTQPLLPVWLSLGDLDNIFMYRNVATLNTTKYATLGELHEQNNFLNHAQSEKLAEIQPGQLITCVQSLMNDDESDKWYYESASHRGPALSLMMAVDAQYKPPHIHPKKPRTDQRWASAMGQCVFESTAHCGPPPFVYLPGGADLEVGSSNGLFHRDSAGRTCFSAAEAMAASEFLVALGLEEKIKARLQEKRFVLPQQHEDVIAGFCNENVYGKLNVLAVTGVVRLDRDAPKGSLPPAGDAAAAFDAWPPPEVLSDDIHTNLSRGHLPYKFNHDMWSNGIVARPLQPSDWSEENDLELEDDEDGEDYESDESNESEEDDTHGEMEAASEDAD